MIFETAAADILGPERPVQGQPADGASDVVGAAQYPAIDQDARADACADGQEDRVAAASSDPAPCLAQDVTGAVAVDDDPDTLVRKRGQDFAAQRIILPAGNVGRPDLARPGVTDARNRNPDGADVFSSDVGSG